MGDFAIPLIWPGQQITVPEDMRDLTSGAEQIAVKLITAITKWAKAQGAQHVLFYVTSGTRIAQTVGFSLKLA